MTPELSNHCYLPKCLKYLYENDYVKITNINSTILLNCNIDTIKYLHSIDYQFPINICDRICQTKISTNKTIDKCFMFLIDKGYELKLKLILNVLIFGNIDCLKYLQSISGCYDEYILNTLLKHDNVKCFECLYNNGTEESMVKNNKTKHIILVRDAIECLKILRTNGINIFTEENMGIILENDSIKCFKYFHEMNYDFSSIDVNKIKSYTKIIKYICENKCILSPLLLHCALHYGIFDYIYLVLEHGYIPNVNMFHTLNIYYYLRRLDLTRFSAKQMYPIMFIIGYWENVDSINYLYDQGYVYSKENEQIIELSKNRSSNIYQKGFEYLCKNTKLLDGEK